MTDFKVASTRALEASLAVFSAEDLKAAILQRSRFAGLTDNTYGFLVCAIRSIEINPKDSVPEDFQFQRGLTTDDLQKLIADRRDFGIAIQVEERVAEVTRMVLCEQDKGILLIGEHAHTSTQTH